MPTSTTKAPEDILDHAREILAGTADPSGAGAAADSLERWRYQILNDRLAARSPRAGTFTEDDRRLLGSMDVAARALRGLPALEPRWPRAILDPATATKEPSARLREALALDPDELARRATRTTLEHFGRRTVLYAPLYLASQCANRCSYCGFRLDLDIERRRLTRSEVIGQASILKERGFRNVLLVAGDFPRLTTLDYFLECTHAVGELDMAVSLEIAAQGSDAYLRLAGTGAEGVTLYMETYDEELYGRYHLAGPKTSFDWRLEALERAAEAGTRRLGLGVLLGLAEPERDLERLVRHGAYLQERFPECRLAFSLPRIHEAPSDFQIPCSVDDETLVRFYAALRLAFPDAELVLSTREPEGLRARLATLCITQMSAGSSTTPGGYGEGDPHSGEQFPVTDRRSPAEVETWLRGLGREPLWAFPKGDTR